MYPYAEPLELKVKSIVNFATQSIGFSQIERLEKAILEVLKSNMDDQLFLEFLMKPMRDGGVGLHRDEAAEMTRKVFSVVEYSKDVFKFRENVHQDTMFLHQKKFIDHLLYFIATEIGVVSTKTQLDILRTAVAERVGGIIGAGDFEERLALPEAMGGAAYDADTAYRIVRHMEKLIAQGGYIIRANELLGAHS
jgi:hypothetical protein